ncbi:MAG TPA: serine/threonine-protein kinase [Gemmataceae bacterium]|jgi:serine/threonine protein kinase/WD40 repeat protein
MTADVRTSALLDELEKYNLLAPTQLKEARNFPTSLATDAKELAAELIRRGWLTPFQVNRLLQGRADSLTLGPYRLLERIGQGGMGQVYKARHIHMDRLIALKLIHADHLDRPELLDRFRREMQAAAKLIHPNVVLAHDAGLAGDVYFLAMEHIDGADLKALLTQRGRLDPTLACECIRQAALGLQHAHERGLVHRDIKPSNLMLANAGNVVKVLDLGLARLRSHRDQEATTSGLTGEGAMMGTPDYIAPEQAIDSRSADIRADIYSLGCSLYHLLTGQPPFPGGSLTEKLLRHQQAEPQAIESLAGNASADLARVVRRMMAKRAQDRYQTPQEVADALAPFASSGCESLAAPPSIARCTATSESAVAHAVETTGRSGAATLNQSGASSRTRSLRVGVRRHRVLVLAALAGCPIVALMFVLGVGLVLWRWVPGSNPLSQGQSELDPHPRAEPLNPAEDKRGGSNIVGPIEADKLPTMPADGPARLLKALKGHTAMIQCLVFSPDGKQLASGADDNQVRLWDGLTGEGQGKPLTHSAAVRALAFSPDGKRLAAAGYDGGYDASIKLWDLADRREPRTLPWKNKTGTPSLAEVHGLAFSPDGKRLASGGGPLRLWNLDKPGELVVRTWQKSFPSYLYGVTFAPNGKTVAAGCHDWGGDSVRVWETDAPGDPKILQGNKDAIALGHYEIHAVLAYAAGGKLLVRVTSNGRIGFPASTASVIVWDVTPGEASFELRDTFQIPGGTVFALTSAADGHFRVAVASGKPERGGFRQPELISDEIQIWDDVTRKVRVVKTGHKSHITALAFSPDGSRLATGSVDQSVKLWDLTR